MSAAFANGADAVRSAASNGSKQLKSNVSGKALDNTRKQAGSPIDGPTKKKAWDNTNASIRNANGNVKPPSPAPGQGQGKVLHERAIFLFSQMHGQDVTISLTSGEQFAGVYSGLTDGYDNHIIKMAKQIRRAAHSQVNGNAEPDYTGSGPDHELSFHTDDVVSIVAQGLKLAAAGTTQHNGTAGFRTDTQISGQESQMFRERELQRWQPDASTDVDLSLDVSSAGEWDQFAANKRLYGVDTDYNEDIYTTSIDRANPEYRRREMEAERIAAEIERSAPSNAHVAEERTRDAQRDDAGGDEEDKYSGVRRDAGALPKRTAGAYIPPSQRPITGTPTVPGAPFDPAIISSEIKVKTTATPAAVAPPAETAAASQAPAASEPPPAAPATNLAAANHGPEYHVSAARDAFKHFANTEKLRIKQAQEAKRNNVRQEKNVKLNDLKKFAANFKLNSRVPDDLVPILAKDPDKQVEIQTKAEQAAKEAEMRSKERSASKASSAASPAASTPSQAGPASTAVPPSGQAGRKGVPALHAGAQAASNQSPRGQNNTQISARQAFRPQPLPANLRMPSGPQPGAADMPLSPASTAGGRALNVKAQEFVFRPGAHAFAPTTSPSPAQTASNVGPSPSTPHQPIASFFDSKKTKETIPLEECFDAITFLAAGDYTEEQKKKYAPNGGIPNSYHTPVTWGTTKENENLSMDHIFKSRTTSQGPSPMQTPLPGQMPQQLPPHGMPVPAMPVPNARQPYYGPQAGNVPGYPGPGMPGQFQQQHNVQNSPRIQSMGPFNGQVPMQAFQNQGYAASPSMAHRQPMPPGGMMAYQGQVMQQPRQPYPGHPFPPQHMGGHMMMPNPSAGGFNGPMPGFSPMPHQAQPHMPYPPQHGLGGFMAGSPRTHPMSQQGSQQGYPPHPPPGGQHPMHFQRTMSGGYHQMTPGQQAAMPHHGSPGMGPAQGDEVK